MVVQDVSPWRAGNLRGDGRPSRLLFGSMFEDASVELSAFPPGQRVFAIGSAGDTAFALAAAGFEVSAVDIDREQVRYMRDRLAGALTRPGQVDDLLGAARLGLRLAGWSPAALVDFLSLTDPQEQVLAWARLERPLRAMFPIALHPAMLGSVLGSSFRSVVPPGFGAEMLRRLRRGWVSHANATNPYARLLLTGRAPCPPWVDERGRIEVGEHVWLEEADAVRYLEGAPRGSYGGFALSNILDGPDRAYRQRLLRAVEHAASPDAVMVVRSFQKARTAAEDRDAVRDRTHLWGRVIVRPVVS